MPEEILCSMFSVNITFLNDSNPFRKDLRDSFPMPGEILCSTLSVNSFLFGSMDASDPLSRELRD